MSIRLLTTLLFVLTATPCFAELSLLPREARVGKVVERYAGDDTLAVAAIEINGQWVTGVQKEVAKFLGPQANEIVNSPAFAMTLGFVESFRSAGAKELVVIFGTTDLNPNAGPLLAITTESDTKSQAVKELASGLLKLAGKQGPDLKVLADDKVVLLGQNDTVKRYRERTNGGQDLAAPFVQLIKQSPENSVSHAWLFVDPGNEPRRVIRELWPRLDSPFEKLTGELLADRVEHLQATITAPADWTAEITVDTATPDTAMALEAAAKDAWQLLLTTMAGEGGNLELPSDRPLVEQLEPNSPQAVSPEILQLTRRASKLLTPTREENKLRIALDADDEDVKLMFADILVPAVASARDNARRMQRMNNFKQMALAILNFESANKYLPAAAGIVDQEGKPLLSWRVAVLPYLGETELFYSFRLNEPWDSPHNKKLIEKMPPVYAADLHPELAAAGKTTFLVPSHPGSIFPPSAEDAEVDERANQGQRWHYKKGVTFVDIRDGTSNTLLIIEVPPELAVPWTKPADWEVDLAKVIQQLRGKANRQLAVSAYCDGSAHAWDLRDKLLEENLPKFISRAGGEIISRP